LNIEWFIGHSRSTYRTKIDSEKAEFRKIEPYLHRSWKDKVQTQTRVDGLEMVNQSLRNRDKLKDDAIASDQLMAQSIRLQGPTYGRLVDVQ
jgi:hypothetical protein